ncbi:hypothetical protein DIPPA_21630 [Diplonema papillatum]|nr:hypothetical protein DIPPA_21630 [Diplonema papillatum]
MDQPDSWRQKYYNLRLKQLRQRSELERRLWEAEADQYVTTSASEVREAVELLGPPEVEACIMESEHELFAGLGP